MRPRREAANSESSELAKTTWGLFICPYKVMVVRLHLPSQNAVRRFRLLYFVSVPGTGKPGTLGEGGLIPDLSANPPPVRAVRTSRASLFLQKS